MTSIATAGTLHNDPATHTAPPRKRRRKTVSGATDDCFACRRRGAACDRKRPYCTQCIEIGKECSGYKTTLTWGVGVASRGKLRGKSTPVAANIADTNTSTPVTEETRRRKSSTTTKIKEEKPDAAATNSNIDSQFSTLTSSSYPPSFQPSLPTISAGHEGWHIPEYNEHIASPQHPGARPSVLRHHSLQHIHTAFSPQYDAQGMPHSSSSVGSYPEAEFHSPLEYPQTPGSVAFSEPFSQPNLPGSYTSNPVGSSVDSYMDNLSSSIDSLHSVTSFADTHMLEVTQAEQNSFVPLSFDQDEMIFSPGFDMALSYNPFDHAEQQVQEEEIEPDNKALALFDTRFSGNFFHMTPRLQSLLEYYDRHVCTYLVAFDGPENPYRNILQLASQNEGLQNAIAALATNNLRMRRKESPRQIGFVQEITDAFDGSSRSKEFDEPTAEETCYKQMSIDQLNMQLTDPRAAHDDSVLATLLILCLFHVCDSGFSKFKTQLAGVQKLLSLRSPHGQSDFTGWVEMFFIWFDVMTSAVNDREIVIKGESLDLMDYSANLGALEQFSGCDGRLFKLIARLGRLNLLAQGKPVRPQPNDTQRPSMSRKSSYNPKQKRKIPRSLSAADYANVDGNGWGTPVISSDEEDNTTKSRPSSDDRHEFWTEWNDIRSRLQAWKMESASPPPSSTSAPEFEMGQRDLLHINESFRYSALLYTERLGHPVLPSSHPNFQKYVSQALFHITSLEITSCVNKFLLWPLFIIGTECVDEAHRNIVRTRCIEVAKESGFYNNISGLEVLERVWREVGHNVQGMEAAEIKARRRDSEAGRTGRYGQAFRWRKAMDRVDGEYILI